MYIETSRLAISGQEVFPSSNGRICSISDQQELDVSVTIYTPGYRSTYCLDRVDIVGNVPGSRLVQHYIHAADGCFLSDQM